MEITGTIIAILPVQTGQGKNGVWKSQDAILETDGQYPKKVCFNLYGDKIDQYPLQIGNKYTVQFEVESREYNGRWFTTVKAWKLVAETTPQQTATAPPANNYGSQSEVATPPQDGSDLPF